MLKRVHITLSFIAMLLAALATVRPAAIRAYDPSFPTRTPTPGSEQPPENPTSPPTDPGAPGNPGNPPPTETPPAVPGSGTVQPAQTSTAAPGGATGTTTPAAILGGTIRANPGGRGECSDTPYIQALDRLIVYGGPGMDYGPVSTLEADEMRPIAGRAAYAEWWQIQVKPNLVGWVQDRDVAEFGNTALVPVVAPPAINGATPTPGAPWNPTPLPLLTCVPTPTPTATPTATATIATGAGAGANTAGGDQGAASPSDANAAAPDSNGSESEMVSAEIIATPLSADQSPAVTTNDPEASLEGAGMTSRGSTASRAASPTSMTNLILPLAGLGLIAAGIVLALASRKRDTPRAE